MFTSTNGELVRPLQADLIAKAQHQALVREALGVRTGRPRHLVAVVLLALARRLEPVGARVGREAGGVRREAAGVRPELPCAVSPC